jgi:hypothetical protein
VGEDMRNHTRRFIRWAGLLAISLLFFLPIYGQDQSMQLQSAVAEQSDNLKANLEIANAQHDIILLHIKNDQFDKVWSGTQFLLSIKFPAEQELSTVKSIYIITERLFEKSNSALAHQILTAAEKALTDNANKAKVYLMQARAYKREGLDEKAIECFKKSQELNARSPK